MVVRKVLVGGSVSFLLSMGGMLGGIVANVILSRNLGPTEFGTYSIALATAMLIGILCAGGLDASVVRTAPERLQAGSGVGALMRFVFLVQFILHGIAALFLVGAYFVTPNLFGLVVPIDVASIIVIALGTANLTAEGMLFRSRDQIVLAQLYQHPIRSFFLAASALAVTMAFGKIGSTQALMLTAGAILFVWILSTIHSMRVIAQTDTGGARGFSRRRVLTFGMTAVVAGTFQQAGTQAPVFLLGALGTHEQAGLFAVTTRLTVLITAVTTGVATYVCPSIVLARRNQDWHGLAVLVRTSAWVSFVCAAGATVFLVVGGKILLGLFGHGFVAAYPALIILTLFVALAMGCGVPASLLSMTDHERQVPTGVAVGLAIHLPIAIILIPRFGASGAAIAAGAGYLACNLFWALQVWRLIGIDCTIAGSTHATFARHGGKLATNR